MATPQVSIIYDLFTGEILSVHTRDGYGVDPIPSPTQRLVKVNDYFYQQFGSIEELGVFLPQTARYYQKS